MTATLNYYWRLFATGGCFAVFGLGGFALWTVVFPVVSVFPGSVKSRRIRSVIRNSFGVFLRLMEIVGIMRMEVVGAEKLCNSQGMLVLANHPTLIDVVALVSLMPNASCVVKQALWKNPLLGGVVHAAGYISNADSDSLIDDCARDLRAGNPLLVFPEGTRSRPGEPLSFQRGAAYIALRSRMPVLPVLIDCTPSTLTKRERWYHIPLRPFQLRIEVLDPLCIDLWVSPDDEPSIKARKLTRAFETYFTGELGKWTN